MKNNRCLAVCMMLFCLLVLGSAPLTYSQDKTAEPSNTIILKVTAPNGTWARVMLSEGEALTFENEKTGEIHSFVPVIGSVKNRTVEVKAGRSANATTDA